MLTPGDAFPRVDGKLRCGPFSVQELAERFGTPLFLYSMDAIRERLGAFSEAFAPADPLIAYSVKGARSAQTLPGRIVQISIIYWITSSIPAP